MSTELRVFVWRFYAYRLLTAMAFFSSVITVFFTEYGELTLWQAGAVQVWFQGSILVAEIATGAFADTFGRRTSMLVGSALMICGVLVYGTYPTMAVFLSAELLMALGISFASGADTAMLRGMLMRHDAMSEYGRAIRIGRICSLTGISIGAMVGSVIAQYLGYAATMYLTAVPHALAFLLLLSVKDLQVAQKESYLDVVKEGMWIFRSSRSLQQITLNMLVVSTAAYFVIWYYQVVLQRVGIAIGAFGVFHVMLTVSQILVLWGHKWLVKLVGTRQRELQLAAVLTGIGLLVGTMANLYASLVFIALAGGFGLSRSETMADEIAELVPEHRHATVVSTISVLRRGMTAVVILIISPVATYSFPVALVLLALLAFSALLIGLPCKQTCK